MANLDKAQPRCGVCHLTKPEHGGRAHQFSLGGELITELPPARPVVVSGLDIPLRLLLMDKGIITAEELTLKEVALREQLAQGADASQRKDPGRDS